MYPCILHATDLSENHFDICKQAAEISRIFGGKLHLLHVIELSPSLQLAQGLGFAELLKPAKENAVTVMNVLGEALKIPVKQQHVEIGSIKTQILDTAKQLNCSLIIIGSHTLGSYTSLLGSTAHAVAHHAHCDVLTLRVNNAAN